MDTEKGNGPEIEADEPAPITAAGTASGETREENGAPATREEATARVVEKAAKKATVQKDEIEAMSESTGSALLEQLKLFNGRNPPTPEGTAAKKMPIKIRPPAKWFDFGGDE